MRTVREFNGPGNNGSAILNGVTYQLKAGDVVREWRSWEHISTDHHVKCPLESRKEWTHLNSIEVTPDGNWLVSFRLTSTIAIVDHGTGDVRWRWGADNLSHQHHATWLDSGNILVFDNGYFSEFGTFSITDWIGHTSPEVLQKEFGVPARISNVERAGAKELAKQVGGAAMAFQRPGMSDFTGIYGANQGISVNLTRDIRNAIHGLEVWPYD